MSIGELLDIKKMAKDDLSKKLSLSSKKPLLAMIVDRELPSATEEKIKIFLEGASSLDLEIVILADSNMAFFSGQKIKILPYSRVNRKNILEASDMALTFDFSDIEEMLIHGIVPISLTRNGIADYNPNEETGNSFIYKKEDPWHIFAAIVRAIETYKFPYDWKHIVRTGISSVCKH
jgi:hypothetical protein